MMVEVLRQSLDDAQYLLTAGKIKKCTIASAPIIALVPYEGWNYKKDKASNDDNVEQTKADWLLINVINVILVLWLLSSRVFWPTYI